MDQFEEAQKATEAATNSAGSAYRENEQYLKSYEARINRVKNAWTETVISMRDSVLGDSIVVATATGVKFFEILTSIIDTFGLLPTLIGAGTIAFALFNTEMNKTVSANGARYLGFLKALYFETNKATAATKSLSAETSMLGKVQATVSSGLGKFVGLLGRGASFLAGAALPVAGFMLLGSAVSWVTNKFSEYHQEQQKIKDEAKQLSDTYELNTDRIHQLANAYEDLSNRVSSGAISDTDSEYLSVQQELYQLLPHLADRIDAKGQAHLRSSEAIRQEVEHLENLSRLEAQSFVENFSKSMEETTEKIDELREKIRELNNEMTNTGDTVMSIHMPTEKSTDDLIAESFHIREINALLDEQVNRYVSLGDKYAEAIGLKGALTEQDREYIDNLVRQNAEMLETEEGIKELQAIVQRYAGIAAIAREAAGDLFDSRDIKKLKSEQIDALESIGKAVKDGETNWDNYRNSLSTLFSAEEVDKIIEHLENTVKNAGKAAQDGAIFFGEFDDELGDVGDSAENYASKLDELTVKLHELVQAKQIDEATTLLSSDLYSEVSNKVAIYNKLLEDLAQGKRISAQEAMELIAKEHQLAEAITIQNGVVKVNTDLVKTNRDAYINAYQDKGKAIQAELNAEKTALQQKLRAFGIEIQGIKTVAEARRQAIAQYQQQYKGMEGEAWFTAGMSNVATQINVSLAPILQAERTLNSLMGMASSGFGTVGTSIGKSSSSSSSKASKAANDAARKAEEAQRRVLEVIQAQIDAYERKANMLNASIAHEEYYLSLYDSTSQQYRQRQKNIAQLKKQQADYHLQTIKYIEGQLKSNKRLNAEQRNELQKTLVSTKQTYYSTLQQINSINKEIKKSYEDIADEFIQVYKDVHTEMRKVALKTNQDEMDLLRRNHDQKIKMLDEELAKYDEIIQAKLKEIDQEKSEEDFNKELAKKQQERTELLRKIDVLSMDDSMEARNKVAQLKEELSAKELEIEEFVADRERELRKESLRQQLEDKRQQIDAEKEMEDEHYEHQRGQLEQQREEIERHYENLLNDERMFAQMREQILNGNISSMTNMLKGFSSDVSNNMQIIGKSISQNLIDRINEAQKKLNSITQSYTKMTTPTTKSSSSGSAPKSTSTSSSSSSKAPKVGSKVKVNKANASAYMDAYGRQVRPWADQAKAAGVSYGAGLYLVNQKNGYGALSKTNNINGAIAWVKLSDLVGLNTGGLIGNLGGTKDGRLAMLHSNELVNNPVETENLKIASQYANSFLAKLPSILKGVGGTTTSSETKNEFNWYIENFNGTREDSNNIFKEFNSMLQGKGVRFVR